MNIHKERCLSKANSLKLNKEQENKLLEVFNYALNKHAGQLDKQGLDYIEHPLSVMEMTSSYEEAIVALLHDVLEDTDATVTDLFNLGLNNELVEAVVALTRKKEEIYIKEFIYRVKHNSIATKVKIYDLKHNLSRIDGLPIEEQSISQRYERALKILESKG